MEKYGKLTREEVLEDLEVLAKVGWVERSDIHRAVIADSY